MIDWIAVKKAYVKEAADPVTGQQTPQEQATPPYNNPNFGKLVNHPYVGRPTYNEQFVPNRRPTDLHGLFTNDRKGIDIYPSIWGDHYLEAPYFKYKFTTSHLTNDDVYNERRKMQERWLKILDNHLKNKVNVTFYEGDTGLPGNQMFNMRSHLRSDMRKEQAFRENYLKQQQAARMKEQRMAEQARMQAEQQRIKAEQERVRMNRASGLDDDAPMP